jgi:hypothetical protein
MDSPLYTSNSTMALDWIQHWCHKCARKNCWLLEQLKNPTMDECVATATNYPSKCNAFIKRPIHEDDSWLLDVTSAPNVANLLQGTYGKDILTELDRLCEDLNPIQLIDLLKGE